jgi:molecular chaperone GrpE
MADELNKGPAASPAGIDPSRPDAVEAADLATLKTERDELYDRLLRKSAEFDNYRKRVERERREQADQTMTSLLGSLLLVVDDFELALAAQSADVPAYRKGVELIHAKLLDLLRTYDVRPIDALGADFDPKIHEAVSVEESPSHRGGEVIGEMRRGYMIGDRLLRPAMVKVAKA